MQRAVKLTYTALIALILAAIFIVSPLKDVGAHIARADVPAAVYSNALDDLQKDDNFNASDYPIKLGNYTLQVIQIAESTAGELFVYVYHACGESERLRATSINMALSQDVTGTKLYSLMFINSAGVFCKYRVNGVTVSNAETRYYNISSIYRAWDKDFDGDTGNNNTINQKAFTVGKVFEAKTVEGNVTYSLQPTYVVQIIDPYSDYLTYIEGLTPWCPSIFQTDLKKTGSIHSHYVAFSTDWEIDRLMSADLHYYYRSAEGFSNKFWGIPLSGDIKYGSEQEKYTTVTYSDKYEKAGSSGFIKYNYSWDRIQRVSEFIAGEPNLTEETKSNLTGKQWILRFAETEHRQTETNVLGYKTYKTEFTVVDRVTILRLEFETDGIVYNLGAVSDEVSGDEYPGNAEPKPDKDKSFWEKVVDFFKGIGSFFVNLWNVIKGFKWWQWLLIGLGLILGVGLIVALVIFGVQAVFSFIWWLIKKLFQGLWWLVTLPFRLIFKAIKNRKAK